MKNFGIFMRYDTRTCTVNMYKEYRDVTLCGAVSQLYLEMAGRRPTAWDLHGCLQHGTTVPNTLRHAHTSSPCLRPGPKSNA